VAGKSDAKNLVLSLAKGFRVLEAFSAAEPELPLAEVARRAALDNATAFRMLNTLVLLGYVRHDAEGRRFRLGYKVLDLGFHAIARTELRDAARPVLRQLVGQVNEAAALSVLEDGDVMYLERVQAGVVRLGVDVRVGSRLPAYCASPGRAILAFLPKDEQARVLALRERAKLTPNTITDLRGLRELLARARRNGYAIMDQETSLGLRALAAPVLDADGHPIAAVSVVAPAMRHSLQEFIGLAAAPVKSAAAEVARIMQAGGAIVPYRKTDRQLERRIA
jgi:IclR family pca regulon transcriptional regulator